MIKYLKRLWNAIWAKTDIDEKAQAALQEAKARIAEIKKELVDVRRAAKTVISQSRDIVGAAKGKKRRGRKPYYKNKKKTNNNFKK